MKQSEAQIAVEVEQQVFSYFEISANYERESSVKGFIQHMIESYE